MKALQHWFDQLFAPTFELLGRLPETALRDIFVPR